jgi:hypothetical protein
MASAGLAGVPQQGTVLDPFVGHVDPSLIHEHLHATCGQAQGGSPCYRSSLRPPRLTDASRGRGHGSAAAGWRREQRLPRQFLETYAPPLRARSLMGGLGRGSEPQGAAREARSTTGLRIRLFRYVYNQTGPRVPVSSSIKGIIGNSW